MESITNNLIIMNYPKTTYFKGETFNKEGLKLGCIDDKGQLNEIDKSDVVIKDSEFIEIGEKIVSIDTMNQSVDLTISVISKPTFEWKSHIFGQSVTPQKNYINELDDGTIEIVALEGGGKVTEDHDGISFFFTEIEAEDNFELSATIDVKKYAKEPYDGQESFGIMVRDIIGEDGDPSLYAANVAAIGGFSRTPSSSNGIQLVTRKGIKEPSGEGSQGLTTVMIDEHKPKGVYKLTLKKTNSGFTGRVNNGEDSIIFEPDILKAARSKVYVGFFTARLATIEVSDIQLSVSKANTDAPKVVFEQKAVHPELYSESLEKTSSEKYALRICSNVSGELTVYQDEHQLVAKTRLEKNEQAQFETHLTNAETSFNILFEPVAQLQSTSSETITKRLTVEKRIYIGDMYISPEGSTKAAGTREDPLDLDTAIHFIKPGQRMVVLDGTYHRQLPFEIKKYNDGTEKKKKTIISDKGAHPVFDFNEETIGGVMSGNHWHIKGIDFTRSKGDTNGFRLGGSNNIIELCQFYRNGDTGLQISRTDKATSIKDWPGYNLILNCTSFDNRDPSNNNADGFACKVSSGEGNIFRGCVSYNNIDDGWDLYSKVGLGKIGKVLIEDCVTYNNGFVSYNDEWTGDGNGFKMGGEGLRVEHEIKNSVAFNNLTKGFTSNFNPAVKAKNNISYNNQEGNLEFFTFPRNKNEFVIDGFISYQQHNNKLDVYPNELESENNFFFDGKYSRNNLGVELSNVDFNRFDFTGVKRDKKGNILRDSIHRMIGK